LRTGIEFVKADPEFAQTGQQLRLDGAMDRVIDPLVCGGLDVPVDLANADNFCHFPAGIRTEMRINLRNESNCLR
jgi:hypothetical protein